MRRVVVCFLIIALAIFLSACAAPTRVEKHFGKSVKQAQVNQVLDPEAELNLDPVTGMDGKAAQAGIEKYRMSFDGSHAAAPPPAFLNPGTQVGNPTQGSGYSK